MTRGCMLSDFSATLGEISVFDLNKQNNPETNEMDALNLMGCRTHVYIYIYIFMYIYCTPGCLCHWIHSRVSWPFKSHLKLTCVAGSPSRAYLRAGESAGGNSTSAGASVGCENMKDDHHCHGMIFMSSHRIIHRLY